MPPEIGRSTTVEPFFRYERRRPEETVLYQVVARHLRTFLEMTEEAGSIPSFVKRDFERFLRCGILAHGFARVRCKKCGDMLAVAFSCKARCCVSCRTRQMNQTAALLVERVLPRVPIRHCVLTLPIPLRLLLARDPETLTGVLGVFIQTLSDWIRQKAGISHSEESPAEVGAVTQIHRAGSALNPNVHFHTLITSGVFVRVHDATSSGQLEFLPIEEPDRNEFLALETAVARSIVEFLEKRGVLAEGEVRFDSDESDVLDRCQRAAAAGRIPFGPHVGRPVSREGDLARPPGSGKLRRRHGFDLFLGSSVQDRFRLERMCRYLARPPLAEGRLAWCKDGRVRLELPRPWADGTTAVILDPLDLLGRLASLVPRPFSNQIRYHGVLAPNAAWRRIVIPVAGRSIPRRRKDRTTGGSWIPWSEIMKRVFRLDVLRCACGGQREVVAFITRPEAIRAILESRGLPTEPPTVASSWWGNGRLLWN